MKRNLKFKNFATVLYDSPGSDQTAVYRSMQMLDEWLKKIPMLKLLIQSKRMDDDLKSQIIRNVFSQTLYPLVVDVLCLLAKERSVDVIRDIIKVYSDVYQQQSGIVHVQAYVAEPLNDELQMTIQKGLDKALDKKADLKVNVDTRLLGGIKFRIKNTFLDASLISRLNRLRGELLQS